MLEFNATFFVAMFSFIIFMLIMNSILYKPLNRIDEERENLISENYSHADVTANKISELKEWCKESIIKAETLAKNNFNKLMSGYKSERDVILDTARSNVKREIAVANAEFDGDEREAKLLLKKDILSLVNLTVSKILGKPSDIKELDEEILNSCLK